MYLETLRSRIDTHAKDTTVHVTADEKSLWNSLASLFELVDIGTEESPLMAIRAKYGLFSNSFISARGSDPEAGQGGGSGGLDVQAMWYALAQPTGEKINVSHIPAIGMDKVSGLADALAGKLSGITGDMVTDALGYTPYDASQIDAASVKYAASAGKVAHALTIYNDGGSSSASAKTYNGSAAVTINIPTTLPASDVYSWAKQPVKPSYTFSEIGSKPSTLSGYGITDGVNAAEATGHLNASVSGHTLSIGVASGYTIPTASQITLWDKICALFDVDTEGNVYVTGSKGFWSNSFISARGSDPEAGSGGGSGVDMESVWYALAQPTTEKINVSHIPLLQQLSGTLTNAQLANSAITVAGVSVSLGGAVTTAQIASALTGSGYKLTDTTYTLTKSGSTITLTGSNGSKTSVTDSNTTYTLGSFGITATAAEINKLDGLATTAAELGYVHGVTSSIQTQLDGKLSSGLGISTFGVSGTNLIGWTYNGATRSTVTQSQLRTMLGLGSNAYTSTAYLPLTGGTMSGLLNLKYSRAGLTMLDITNTAGGEVFLRTYSGSTYAGAFTTNHKSYGTAIFNAIAGQLYLGITNSGVPHFQGNTLLHSGNYTNYTVTKTGVGASGAWPISISGIANRAVYLTSTYTGRGGLQPPSYFNGMGLKVNMMNKPVSYCDVIFVNGYGGQGSDVPYVNALAFQKTANAHGEVYHARADYGGSSWGTWYKFLDEYNYAGILDSRYVKKSGDTMSGALTISTSGCPLYIQGGSSAESYLKVRLGGTDKSAFGYSSSLGTYLYSYTYGGYLSLTDSGLARIYKGSSLVGTLWHSGNDGSESGLDADLLDGYQSTSFNLATNLGACEDYGVYVIGLMQITDYTTAGNMANGTLIFIRQNGNNPAQKIIYSLSTRHGSNNVRFGYLTLSTNIYVQPCTFTYNGKKWAGFQVSSASSYSSGVVCVRDGLRLGERSTPFLLKYGVSNTGAVINSEVNSSVVINGADIIESGVHSNAFFGNASSATKLATARSIWGQTFDGTQGVDGHLFLGSPDYRLYFGTSGQTPFLTATGGLFQIVRANNTSWTASLVAVNISTGNMGLGTTSPSYKLDVIGTIHSTTGIWSDGYVSAKGQDTTSDARYKRDVASLPAQAALAVLMRLRPSTWAWKDDGRRGAGFIAQEVLGVLPEAVREVGGGEDRHLALNYQMLHAYEVCLLQAHESELERLRGRVLLLENEIKRIRHGS